MNNVFEIAQSRPLLLTCAGKLMVNRTFVLLSISPVLPVYASGLLLHFKSYGMTFLVAKENSFL